MSFSQSLDRLKESFLWAAAQGGNSQDCESLLDIGADVNWKGQEGDTPVLAACRRGHVRTVELLIAHGADINIAGNDTLAPIHVAARRGDLNTLNVLLECNAVTTSKTKDGQTALDIAKAKGFEDIYARLMQTRNLSAAVHSQQMRMSSMAPSSSSSGRSTPTGRRQAATAAGGAWDESDSDAGDRSSAGAIPVGSGRARGALPSLSTTASVIVGSLSSPRTVLLSAAAQAKAEPPSSPKVLLSSSSSSSSLLSAKADAAQLSHSASTQSASQYQLMGNRHQQSEQNETILALQKMLDQEQRERRSAESKLILMKDQNLYLAGELSTIRNEGSELRMERDDLQRELSLLKGEHTALEQVTGLEQCDKLEKQLKASLAAVEEWKNKIIQAELGQRKDQQLCVICQESEKSVVLLPCRHMCLCEQCSDQVDLCPLCRRPVAHKISVFA